MASPEQEKQDSGKAEDFSRPQDLSEKSHLDAPSGVSAPVAAKKHAPPATAGGGGGASDDKKAPEGGYDSTPIPSPPPGFVGYTVKFTFHRAANLSIGDAHVMSSDPYAFAQLNTGLPQRHKEDPNLRFRTPTIRRTLDPTWNEEWIVANVPSTGFKLKVRVYDEDPADHDDMLGKAHITVDSIDDNWQGIHNQTYRLTVRDSSKRALLLRAAARCFRLVDRMQGELVMSIQLIGRTGEDHQNGKAYTLGPCRWCRHYSPMLGRITHTKDFGDSPPSSAPKDGEKESKPISRYNFQANEFQLDGPVPAELYHRFVEFQPWVKRMFTTTGFQGVILGKALHHQHTRVYNYGRSTEWGHFPQGPSPEMTKQFLDLVHYDQGGRIFTYVLTLDSLWRFTETGKEFGIDMLSKHTMHSDVSIYIAFSGEFFIRRLKHRHRPPPPDPVEGSSQQSPPEHAANEIEPESEEIPSTDPSHYELIIDNDSGTYRPNAKLLPVLAAYLSSCLPGLHILTLDCQADADKMARMKGEQRERKKREGDNLVYAQGDGDSISSSDDDMLTQVESDYKQEGRAQGHFSTGDGSGREHGALEQLAKDAKIQGHARMNKMQRSYGSRTRGDGEGSTGPA